jgi:hypothetical protein
LDGISLQVVLFIAGEGKVVQIPPLHESTETHQKRGELIGTDAHRAQHVIKRCRGGVSTSPPAYPKQYMSQDRQI